MQQNRLLVVRQVETKSGAIPDVVLVVNGLPVATLELKNPMTGQTVADAKQQYRRARPQRTALCVQAALPGALCRRYGTGGDDDAAGRRQHGLPAL